MVVQCLRCHAPNMGSPSLIPSQDTRSHMPQLNPRQRNKFFLNFVYFWLCWVFIICRLFSGCGVWASLCGGSLLADPRLQRTDSGVVAHRFSYHTPCGIFPDKSWTHASCIASRFLTAWATREALFGQVSSLLDGGRGEESFHPPDWQRLKMFDTTQYNRYDFVLQHSGTRNVTLLICLNPAKQAPTLQDWQKKKKKKIQS